MKNAVDEFESRLSITFKKMQDRFMVSEFSN